MHERTADHREEYGPETRPHARKSQGDTRGPPGPAQEQRPRMPHERDESVDSQEAGEPSGQRMGKMAHDDLARGLVDTDKGPVLDETYEKLRKNPARSGRKFSP